MKDKKDLQLEIAKQAQDNLLQQKDDLNALREVQAACNDYKQKFDAQKPLIQELTVQLSEKETRIVVLEKQITGQKNEMQQ